jgi:hypothetical protein
MGGYGSGRNGGPPTVESALRLDIDNLVRRGVIQLGTHLRGSMQFDFYDEELSIEFESKAVASEASWLRLKYDITDYWSGEDCKIDDLISLTTSRPPFGGIRWWFRCPRTYRRVRVLHLPLGGRHFWSRRAHRLAYASQRETIHDRAQRRAAKLCKRLGGDWADDTYPEKPSRMRWSTYNRIMDELVAADRLADGGLSSWPRELIGSD